jgi:hypothetical protein
VKAEDMSTVLVRVGPRPRNDPIRGEDATLPELKKHAYHSHRSLSCTCSSSVPAPK